MLELTPNQAKQVEGGIIQLLGAFIAVFAAPRVINEIRKEYNGWGRSIGEAAWEYRHPYNPNG